MKTIQKLIIGAAAAAVLTSCSFAAPGWATNNSSVKTGIAERKLILGISFGTTDLSQTTAAKNGGITKIATVDFKISSGFFTTTYTTIVTGE